MIKTTIIPENNNILLPIPNSYIGKEVEILLYTMDEIKEETKSPVKKDASKFIGILTKEEAEKYHEYLKQARSEWDRDI